MQYDFECNFLFCGNLFRLFYVLFYIFTCFTLDFEALEAKCSEISFQKFTAVNVCYENKERLRPSSSYLQPCWTFLCSLVQQRCWVLARQPTRHPVPFRSVSTSNQDGRPTTRPPADRSLPRSTKSQVSRVSPSVMATKRQSAKTNTINETVAPGNVWNT